MKYLVLFAVVLAVYLLWRSKQQTGKAGGQTDSAPGTAQQQQEMVRCSACSLHLPRAEAVSGNHGDLYCSQEHRLSAGK